MAAISDELSEGKGDRSMLIVRLALLVFAVAAPLGHAALGLGVLLLASPWLIRVAAKDGRPLGLLQWPALALIGASLLSALLGWDLQAGLLNTLALALMAVLGLLASRAALRDASFFMRILMPAFLLSTVVSAILALVQYFLMDVRRTTALLSYTNRLGTILAFFGLLGVAYLVQQRGRLRWLTLPYLGLCLGALGTTLSRAGWVAAGVGGVLLGLRGGRRSLGLFAAVALMVVLLLAFQPTWVDRMQSIVNPAANRDRLTLWQTALDIFGDHPLTGSGPGSFLDVSAKYLAPEAYRAHATPHNLVLGIASDLGLLGVAALGWLLTRLIRMGVYLWRKQDLFIAGVVAAAAAIFVNDLFGQGFYTMQIGPIIWFAFGMEAALYERVVEEPGAPRGPQGEAA